MVAATASIGAATLHLGDCQAVLPTLPPASIDAVVCDPPYGLGFMGKAWDRSMPSADVWRDVLRVLKPGAHLLAFGGTRTYHRMACAIEDAGFEIRDQIGWAFGSGFPKSKNLDGDWAGWGSALKPAWEPVVLARAPLAGTLTANVKAHGVGALNIDATRVGDAPSPSVARRAGGVAPASCRPGSYGDGHAIQNRMTPERWLEPRAGEQLGRWPANLIHDGSAEVVALFPDSNGSGPPRKLKRGERATGDGWGMSAAEGDLREAGAGSAARFFYCAKASRSDRDDGLANFEMRVAGAMEGRSDGSMGPVVMGRNHHPTVKPTDLMRYLCRLVTPPGGVVLDPFMGSGSTGRGALLEGFRFVGIEREPDYFAIASARIEAIRMKMGDRIEGNEG